MDSQKTYRQIIRCVAAAAVASCFSAHAQSSGQPATSPQVNPPAGAGTNTTMLPTVEVTAPANAAIDPDKQIGVDPSQGIKVYTINASEIQNFSQGEDSKFTDVFERAPGVSVDGHGIWHVRGEDTGTSYMINGVPLPRGMVNETFGEKFDTRFISSVSLLDGALPAQYGITIGGVLDITTKQGADLQGVDASVYGGSYNTVLANASYGGVYSNVDYYIDLGYNGNNIGIENPTSSSYPLHDHTDQYYGFVYLCDHLDKTSSLTFMLNGTYNTFQIPNTADLPGMFTLGADSAYDSSNLHSSQIEQQHYGMLSYKKVSGDFTLQSSLISGYAQSWFRPDVTGDLILNGEASEQRRELLENTFVTDMSYQLSEDHLLKFGVQVMSQIETVNSTTTAFPSDPTGTIQTSTTPITFLNNQYKVGYISSAYVADQWQATEKLNVNFGVRFDYLDEFVTENQFSPRVNLVYKATPTTTLFAGYSRFFAPPQEEYVPAYNVAAFYNTTATPGLTADDKPKAERSNYFDAGLAQMITPDWKVGVEGYFKQERNVNDEAQVGVSQIYTPFTYARGYYTGVELASSFARDGFSAFGNLGISRAMGKDINSSQILFGPDDIATSQTYQHVNHDQFVTVSAGAAYTYLNTTAHVDALYGTGFFDGVGTPDPEDPSHLTFNAGLKHDFHFGKNQRLTARFDVINIFDKSYFLHPGGGVETFAAQYGQRRSLYGGLEYRF